MLYAVQGRCVRCVRCDCLGATRRHLTWSNIGVPSISPQSESPAGTRSRASDAVSACSSRIGKSAKDPYKGYPLVEEEWPDGIEGIYGAEFREVCGDLLDSVVARLVGCGIEDSLLQQEWAAVREADAEETDFCRTAAGLGWDPYAIDDAKREEVLALADRFGVMLAEAIPVLNADRTDEGWTVIEQALREAQRNTLSLERICSVRDRISGRGSSARVPWQAGQELAQTLRGELGLDGDPLSTMDALGEALDEEAINAATRWTPVNGGNAILVDGLATCGEDDRPAFAFRTRRWEYGRRFHFCRALTEVLWRPGTNALLTPAHTERQQSNRAFAAEFLAPAVGLRNRVRRARLDEDDIDELAAEFGVSSMVIEHQLANHRIAKLPVGRPRAV